MYRIKNNFFFAVILMLLFIFNSSFVLAREVINLDASTLVPRAEISITPASATFIEDSIFEVPILLNTKGQSMNAIELNLKFDPNKLSIVKPSTGKSIIGIWVQPPKYDNTKGTANFAGTIPGGIVSNSSLIITITFQAKGLGTTDVQVSDSSAVLANDGVGTQAVLTTSRGVYTILPKPPGGVNLYSDTHPFQDHWYNNNSPTIAWTRDPGIVGYSFVLDDKPNTIPDNQNLINETSKSYQNLNDGLWYFHIKALRDKGAWGTTTNYIFRIDTTPPAKFDPKVNYLNDDNINRALVTFFTTDSLSGMDHYEIGVIDKTQAETSSPLFVRSESPYQVPFSSITNSRVIVRAYDMAGNSIDTQISIRPPSAFAQWIMDHSSMMLLLLLIFIILLYLVHYLWGHKVLKKLKIISHLLRSQKDGSIEEAVKEVVEVLQVGDKPVEIKIEDIKNEIKTADKIQGKPEPEIEINEQIKKEIGQIEEAEISPKTEEIVEILPNLQTEIKIEPKIETANNNITLPDIDVPKPPIYNVLQKEFTPDIAKKPENIVNTQNSMIKDKLSKPVVSFQAEID